jgi:N-methylhydantoinase A/oxoprolinase/acetone carboxylase beta subunit
LSSFHHREHKRITPDHIEYWFLQREPRRMVRNDRAREVIEILRQGPMASPDILDRMGVYHPLQFGGQSLISQDIIGRAALTPTDLLHLNGAYAPWNKSAAEVSAWLFSRIGRIDIIELIEQVMQIIAERIAAEVVSFISAKSLKRTPAYVDQDDLGLWLFEENLYQQHPYLGSEIALKIPIIGIGAPAKIFLPPVAEILHAELIVPDNFQVANAVGAVAGTVMVNEEAWIFPQMRGMYIAGYYVHSGGQLKRFSKLEPALEYAREITGKKALERAQVSGATDPYVEFEQLPDGAESYRIRAKAVGNPSLAKGK